MQLSWPARVYGACVLATALALGAVSIAAVERLDWVLALVVLVSICSYVSSVSVRRSDMSLSLVLVAAALLLTGTAGAVLVAMVGAVGGRSGPRLVGRLCNAAHFGIAAAVAGVAYTALNGPVGRFDDGDFPVVIGLVLLASAIYFLVCKALAATVLALVEHMRWGAMFRSDLALVLPNVAYGLFGLLLALLWVDYTPVSGLLLLMPLLAARSALQQHANEFRAYDATLRALVTAIEVKDGYTGGHSERVSRIAVMIAREARMSEHRVEATRYAALLHDVGKTGIPRRILAKHGKLTPDEYDVIKTHPERGIRMLEGIDFLSESLTGVYHHHERMDGAGYPLGLLGPEIPQIARIVMVSDAFDAMTSTRSYRPARSTAEAVEELRRCEGTQFDPLMVDALVRALGKQGWVGTPEPFAAAPLVRDAHRPESAADVTPRVVAS